MNHHETPNGSVIQTSSNIKCDIEADTDTEKNANTECSIESHVISWGHIGEDRKQLYDSSFISYSSYEKHKMGTCRSGSLPATVHQTITINPLEGKKSCEESISDVQRKRRVSGSHYSPILRSRCDSGISENRGSTDSVYTKRYLTSKRKCSFSSFNECRYLEDDGKTTTTYFFSSDTVPIRAIRNENSLQDNPNQPNQMNSNCVSTQPCGIGYNRYSLGHQHGPRTSGLGHQHNSPVRKAVKRHTKNNGISKSFNVSADIRRKLFVNRYKEWSINTHNPDPEVGPATTKTSITSSSKSFKEQKNFSNRCSLPYSRNNTHLNSSLNNSENYQALLRNSVYSNEPNQRLENTRTIDEHSIDLELKSWTHTDNESNDSEASHSDIYVPKQGNNVERTDSARSIDKECTFTTPFPEGSSNGQYSSLLSMTSHVSFDNRFKER